MLFVNLKLGKKERCFKIFVIKKGELWMAEFKLMVPLRPLLSGERLQTDGSPAKLNPQTNLVWSAEYYKRHSNVLQTFELDISENFCISDFFWKLWQSSNTWAWMVIVTPPLWRDIRPSNRHGPNLVNLTHGSFCLVPGANDSVWIVIVLFLVLHRVSCAEKTELQLSLSALPRLTIGSLTYVTNPAT